MRTYRFVGQEGFCRLMTGKGAYDVPVNYLHYLWFSGSENHQIKLKLNLPALISGKSAEWHRGSPHQIRAWMVISLKITFSHAAPLRYYTFLSLCKALRMEFNKVMLEVMFYLVTFVRVTLNEFQLLLSLYPKDLVSFCLMWGSNWGRCLMQRTSQLGILRGDKSSTTLRLGSYRRCHPVRAGKPFSGTAGRCLTRLLVSEWKFCPSAQRQSHDWTEWWKAGQPVWKC